MITDIEFPLEMLIAKLEIVSMRNLYRYNLQMFDLTLKGTLLIYFLRACEQENLPVALSVQTLALIWPHFLIFFHQNSQSDLSEVTLAGCPLNGGTKEVKQLVQGQEWNLSELHLCI